MQTVCWVQRYVGDFHEDFAGGRGGGGDGVEEWGAEGACHEGFHCWGCHVWLERRRPILCLGRWEKWRREKVGLW